MSVGFHAKAAKKALLIYMVQLPLFIFIYLFYLKSKKQRDTERESVHPWFIPQVSATAGIGPRSKLRVQHLIWVSYRRGREQGFECLLCVNMQDVGNGSAARMQTKAT